MANRCTAPRKTLTCSGVNCPLHGVCPKEKWTESVRKELANGAK